MINHRGKYSRHLLCLAIKGQFSSKIKMHNLLILVPNQFLSIKHVKEDILSNAFKSSFFSMLFGLFCILQKKLVQAQNDTRESQ